MPFWYLDIKLGDTPAVAASKLARQQVGSASRDAGSIQSAIGPAPQAVTKTARWKKWRS